MNTTAQIQSPAPVATLTYEEAKAIYRRLCEKAKRVHGRDDSASRSLFDSVCAFQDEWSFNQDFRVQELKNLNEQDRSDFMRLVCYVLGESYWTTAFNDIARATIGEL